MTPRDVRNICTTGNSCKDTLPCATWRLCHIKKNRHVVLCMPKHYNTILRGVAHNSHKNYLGVWWHGMFNIYFSVLTNFVMFVYLDVFLQFNFVLMNIRHFLELFLSYPDCFNDTFKDHMKILASSLYHKSHYPESHYQHSITNGTDLQKFHFSLTLSSFEK